MVVREDNTILIDSERATLGDKADFEKAVTFLVQSGHKSINVDLGKTIYLPSELMGFMMWKKKELIDIKVNFRISAISSSLKKIFDNAMLSQFFEIDSSTEIVG